MNIFHKRHLALFCTIFAVASICGCVLSYSQKSFVLFMLGATSFLPLLSALLIKRYRAVFIKGFLCVIFALLALLSQIVRVDTPQQKVASYFDSNVNISATVTHIALNKDYLSSYYVDIDSINGKKLSASAVLECEYNAELNVGDVVSGEFKGAKHAVRIVKTEYDENGLPVTESLLKNFDIINSLVKEIESAKSLIKVVLLHSKDLICSLASSKSFFVK